MKDRARLAVDIGGTFTDVALERAGARVTAKVLTTPAAPEEGVMRGVKEALEKAGLAPADIGLVIHGTTLATNALIERRGARTALLTTEGHRDALEMAYENRFEQYDINIDRPKPLVPRWLRLPVRERMNRDGKALVPLDEDSVRAHLSTLEAEGIESVAVGYLHAYANPEHERRTAEILAEVRPDLSITLASEVAPEIREYERLSTAVANAYVRPLMERYLRRLDQALRAAGFACGLLLITSGGGLATLETAAKFPIRLVESGPAGGAVLAAAVARAMSLDSVLSFDMGGTTAKLCLIDDYEPQTARAFEVDRSYRFKKGSGLPVRIPVIEMVEIGAGGGSIAHVDRLGRLQVGPESAGSEPGPVAYGRGGVRPTVTDADAAMGKIAAERFAGGSIALDIEAARAAVAREIGAAMKFDDDMAAYAVSEIVDENMAAAARAHAIEGGHDVAARAMIAFGGAAPLHAARLAEKLGVGTIVVPADAGVGSAIGFLLAPAAYEVVRSRPMRLDDFDGAAIDALFAEMYEEAAAVVRAATGEDPVGEIRLAYMRYRGQGHEIPTPVPEGGLALREGLAALAAAFEQAYRALYGRAVPGVTAEALTWSLRLAGAAPRLPEPAGAAPARRAEPEETRPVFDASRGRVLDYGVYERTGLGPGARLSGPALIVEDQTTTVISAAYDARVDARGNLILTRNGGQ
ncbi:hydantoinase/oxoprolinase family protein [Amphiplicatus metriothermophilus]|uniref:N-methylhydantoinase A n=1 Tax=Amphiplicatus metriothermophilus TaxID=1519374 RepID=A0A239PXT2_9PROT|nr:hydantoinase/oxoprolinase family protein [Amphiplicatus metriothermophilus]MBB5519830.1 N-methylhydantoinase A [Amphiplicatus metriothermophilus]SNT75119.1 N-methylhydantoinase A [Amphiplicatus metriothermophilus]